MKIKHFLFLKIEEQINYQWKYFDATCIEVRYYKNYFPHMIGDFSRYESMHGNGFLKYRERNGFGFGKKPHYEGSRSLIKKCWYHRATGPIYRTYEDYLLATFKEG